MKGAMETPHLILLPKVGERRIWIAPQGGTAHERSPSRLAHQPKKRAGTCLSLSQRERTKVRDFFHGAAAVQTRWIAIHCRVPRAPDDSRTEELGFPDARETRYASGHGAVRIDSCVRLRQFPRQLLPTDNKNRAHKNRVGVAVETCNLQNSGSEGVAKARALIWSRVSVDNERGSCGDSNSVFVCLERQSAPHLYPLPGDRERRVRARSVISHWHPLSTAHRTTALHSTSQPATRESIRRLSLSQRERMKVRDCFP